MVRGDISCLSLDNDCPHCDPTIEDVRSQQARIRKTVFKEQTLHKMEEIMAIIALFFQSLVVMVLHVYDLKCGFKTK